MANDIQKLKVNVRGRYENFMQGGTGSLVALSDVMKDFKIPIDETRMADYKIVDIDFNNLSIEVFDVKTKTTFTSCYSKKSETLGAMAYEEAVSFINVLENSPFSERKRDYRIGEEMPRLEKMTIRNREYGLTFKKTIPGVITNFSVQYDGVQLLVQYFKVDERNQKCVLTNSVFKTGYVRKNIRSFERECMGHSYLNHGKSSPDFFCYDIEGRIIAGSNTKLGDGRLFIEGACFETVNRDILTEVFLPVPGRSPIKDYSSFDAGSLSSAILYAGYSYQCIELSDDSTKSKERNTRDLYHDLEVSKTDSEISLKYTIINRTDYPEVSVSETKFLVPNLENGTITIQEVDNVISELEHRFSDDIFIQFVISELFRFKGKLAIKSGLRPEVLSPLSAKLLFTQSFDEISGAINADKNEYFRVAGEQLEALAVVNEMNEKGKTMILKPIDDESGKRDC